MAKDDKLKAPGIENFVASAGWCIRFMNRFGLCLRQRTKISQKLPKDLDEKVMSFYSFIIKQRRIHNYDLGDIGNMDETPMTFDLPSNRTVASFGAKTIFLRTTGNEKNISQSFCHVWLMEPSCGLSIFLKERPCLKRSNSQHELQCMHILKAGWMKTEQKNGWKKFGTDDQEQP